MFGIRVSLMGIVVGADILEQLETISLELQNMAYIEMDLQDLIMTVESRMILKSILRSIVVNVLNNILLIVFFQIHNSLQDFI